MPPCRAGRVATPGRSAACYTLVQGDTGYASFISREGSLSVWLSVEGKDPASGLEELSDWLQQEPELRGVITSADAEPAPGELGATAEVLVAAVSSGGTLSVLAASLTAFLTLPRRSDVRVVITTPDGRRTEFDAKGVGDVEALIRTLGVDG
jgi:hypothetical protein